MEVRDATTADAEACRAIYAPYVERTAITFEEEVPSVEEMAQRISRAQERYAWLVLADRGELCGFAYARPFAPRSAYRWSCETSVYVAPEHHQSGGGRRLYAALLERLTDRGYRNAFSGLTIPNAASAGLHRAMGYVETGVYRRVGFKLGQWHDVVWLQRSLGGEGPPAGEPG